MTSASANAREITALLLSFCILRESSSAHKVAEEEEGGLWPVVAGKKGSYDGGALEINTYVIAPPLIAPAACLASTRSWPGPSSFEQAVPSAHFSCLEIMASVEKIFPLD